MDDRPASISSVANDPQRSQAALKSRSAEVSCHSQVCYPSRRRPLWHRRCHHRQARCGNGRTRNGDLILPTDSFTNLRSSLIIDLAARHALPAISAYERFPKDGGLMYYGASINVPDQFRQAATYVDRILKGVKPGDLPIQRADKYSLVINFKTAKALGLNVPLPLTGLADELIE